MNDISTMDAESLEEELVYALKGKGHNVHIDGENLMVLWYDTHPISQPDEWTSAWHAGRIIPENSRGGFCVYRIS